MDVVEVWETSELNAWQRPVVEDVIRSCTFPWARLLVMISTVTGEPFIPAQSSDLSRFRATDHHGHVHDWAGWGYAEGHLITARKTVLGVFWTDGRIEIEQELTDPQLIREVFLAEAAHSVDYFLPMNQTMKVDIARLFHGGMLDDHTWWEVADYSEEYYRLMGESFMALFTLAYSDVTPYQEDFVHKATPEMVPEVYRILQVWPDDLPPPPPPPPPPPSSVKPWWQFALEWILALLRRLF